MGNYIICAKEIHSGTSIDDIENPLEVTEIATELVITRLYCLMMLNDGTISKTDTIVTTSERKCLYENIFDNVIDWNTYTSLKASWRWKHMGNEVIDLLSPSTFKSLSSGQVKDRLIPYLPFYQNWDRDKNNIQDIHFSSLKEYDVSNKFICLLTRTRSAWPEKNLSKEYWKKLIKILEDQNIKVFVFGKETEEYATKKTEYVKNFRDWCSIVNHSNCKQIISTITGGVYPAFICGTDKINLVIIDNLNLVKEYGYDPSWYNDCINFTNVNKNIINYLPSTNELVEIVKNGI